MTQPTDDATDWDWPAAEANVIDDDGLGEQLDDGDEDDEDDPRDDDDAWGSLVGRDAVTRWRAVTLFGPYEYDPPSEDKTAGYRLTIICERGRWQHRYDFDFDASPLTVDFAALSGDTSLPAHILKEKAEGRLWMGEGWRYPPANIIELAFAVVRERGHWFDGSTEEELTREG